MSDPGDAHISLNRSDLLRMCDKLDELGMSNPKLTGALFAGWALCVDTIRGSAGQMPDDCVLVPRDQYLAAGGKL